VTKVLIVNGPNLNLLGRREPEIYGPTTLPALEQHCIAWGREMGMEVDVFQSNHEGAIIDAIQQTDADVIVINPGAYTHYSYAIYDALVAVGKMAVEVHISDIHSREPWRATSVIQPACVAQVAGEGIEGYRRALEILAEASP
jgi:3-dehydroquinate dehydratase-2